MSPIEFDQDRALALLLHGTMGETGHEFFRALVRTAASAFNTDAALVTEYLPQKRRLNSLAFWCRGEFIEHYEYLVANTPCAVVIARAEVVAYPERVSELFPTDRDLIKLNAESFLGAPMIDPAGNVIGHFSILHSQPMRADSRMSALFELFAMRASAELQRVRAESRFQAINLEAEVLRDAVHELPDPGEIVGESRPIRQLKEGIARVAPTSATVLIMGETGTGKELVARAIHLASKRPTKPLIRVNCAAIPTSLIESEFFGHERGAFTGAIAKREGRFSLADGGTIFLDEIGEIPIDLQAKLLRVLQEGEFEPIGSARTRHVDVRVIAATNRDLESRVKAGEFREDLYYRLCVFPLHTPPLRKRGCDIAILARRFAQQYAMKMRHLPPTLRDEDLSLLKSYHWPGNVRELQNVIERAIILGGEQGIDLRRAMPGSLEVAPAESHDRQPDIPPEPQILTCKQMKDFERENLLRALAVAGGKVAGSNGAAALLGVPASTLASRMKALEIQ